MNLAEGLRVFTSFHFPDSRLYLLSGFNFIFRSILNGVTLKTGNSDHRVIVASLKQNTAGKNERDPTTKKTKITLLLVAGGGGVLPIMAYFRLQVYDNPLRLGFHDH